MKKWICVALVAALLLLTGCDQKQYQQAQELYQAGNYSAAVKVFASLGDYEDSLQMVTACQYHLAMQLYESKDFQAAETAFLALGAYENSSELALRCRYEQGVLLMAEAAYPEAEAIFADLGEFENSAELVLRCRYERGKELMAAEDYAAAQAIFQTLDGYEDSDALLQQARWKHLLVFLAEQPPYSVAEGCQVGITAFDPDQLTVWAERTSDLGFYVVVDRCAISFTLGDTQGSYQLQTQTQTQADGLTGRSSASATGTVSLAELTPDTRLPRTNFSYYGQDVYGNVTQRSEPLVSELTDTQELLAVLLEQIPALLAQSSTGYTLSEFGFTE